MPQTGYQNTAEPTRDQIAQDYAKALAIIHELRARNEGLKQALLEVQGDCYAVGVDGTLSHICRFCWEDEDRPHADDCTMQFVNEALAKAVPA